MYTFLLSLLALVAGYFIYGRFIEHVFSPDDRPTPAIQKSDGVDFMVLPSWKIFMIQFLNIAGTGPIFGAIMGAKFGPAAYLWIVFGCIFAGAVHDYMMGMLSMRHGGVGLPELTGIYLGRRVKQASLVFSVVLLLLVGAVFVYSPAIILGGMTESMFSSTDNSVFFWIIIVFLYYVTATMLPIDKIIGRIYPLFAFSLIFMAVALGVYLVMKWPTLPELWDGLDSHNITSQPIFPCLFITIACGAISGFHATQSPLMARCVKSERQGRPIFYGAMITEGVIALIWATISSYFFFDGGAEAVGSNLKASAPQIVTVVSNSWLGTFGGILALLGVVAAPITSGDTALRSTRLIIADFLHINQRPIAKRLMISLPIFLVTMLLLWFNLSKEESFNVIWSYFGWANQTLAVVSLWIATVYLVKERKPYILTLIPAVFMTMVTTTFLMIFKNAFALPTLLSLCIGGAVTVIVTTIFCVWFVKQRYNNPPL